MSVESAESAPEKRPPWEERFLRVFAKTGIVLQACKAAKIDRNTAYNHRRNRPEFAARWKAAEEDACDALEAAAMDRIANGSDTLHIFLLKARNPDKFREETLTPKKFVALFEQLLEIIRVEIGESDARRVAGRFEREVIRSLGNGHGEAGVAAGGTEAG